MHACLALYSCFIPKFESRLILTILTPFWITIPCLSCSLSNFRNLTLFIYNQNSVNTIQTRGSHGNQESKFTFCYTEKLSFIQKCTDPFIYSASKWLCFQFANTFRHCTLSWSSRLLIFEKMIDLRLAENHFISIIFLGRLRVLYQFFTQVIKLSPF